MSRLPQPDADAVQHSERLHRVIVEQILASGGSLPFWKFMELALYAPGLGYYSAGATKFGDAGDFITAPELSPLFAACVADALAPVLQQLGPEAEFLEVGGGSGAFAETALAKLLANDALPARYAILEPSADLRERQRERLQQRLPPLLFALVEWLDGPPEQAWNGVLFANEVIDALPTPRFCIREGEVFKEHVALDGRLHDGTLRFVRQDRAPDPMLAAAVRHVERHLLAPFAEGYRGEVLAQLPYWLQAVIGGMGDGAMLFIDYGHGRSEYYQPQRSDGTLRAFRRHHVVADVFAWPGLQDITASVDFTALAEAGTGAGFELAGYCSQASFLLGNRLPENLALGEARVGGEVGVHSLRQQAKQLTLPNAMGERFQAMGFARGVDFCPAFLVGDLSHRL